MKSTQALEKARYELVSALFINFKIEENTILRSTYDEILKPLEIKEIKHFMLLLAKTERNYRSTLELVGDVAAKIIYNRVDRQALSQLCQTLETKFQAVLLLASKAIVHSNFINEAAFLNQVLPEKFQNNDGTPLFTPHELEIIASIGFSILAKLAMEDNFLFHQRIALAATVKMTGIALPIASSQTLLAPLHE